MTRFLTSADKYSDPRDFSGGYRFGKLAGGRRRAATIDLLRGAFGALVKFLNLPSDGLVSKYHPEKHYMRGPGPKWHEKHFLHRASAGS